MGVPFQQIAPHLITDLGGGERKGFVAAPRLHFKSFYGSQGGTNIVCRRLADGQPGIITVTIFNFNKIWNEYFLSLIFANSDSMRPVAVGLFSMINSMKYTGDWSGLFAAVAIVTLPTLVLYILLSERIIAGVTAGGVKG